MLKNFSWCCDKSGTKEGFLWFAASDLTFYQVLQYLFNTLLILTPPLTDRALIEKRRKNQTLLLCTTSLHPLAKMTQQFLFPSPKSLSLIGSREVVGGGRVEGVVRGSNFGLVLVSIALWEISVVADPVISSAC